MKALDHARAKRWLQACATATQLGSTYPYYADGRACCALGHIALSEGCPLPPTSNTMEVCLWLSGGDATLNPDTWRVCCQLFLRTDRELPSNRRTEVLRYLRETCANLAQLELVTA